MSQQLTLGVGTTHVCRCPSFPEFFGKDGFGCGRLWDCGESDCRLGEHAKCPTCTVYYTDHHHAALNRAKREPEYAAKLQRIAANMQSADAKALVA